jgi:predicted transcriptional regulator of viral defense system
VAIAARMRRPSYVSLQSALAYHGVIPEAVAITMSVTTGRPGRWETAVGDFRYRHVHPKLFWGYRQVDFGEGGAGYVALPEKALLDLFHFTAGPIRAAFVRELRLEPEAMDGRRLLELAKRSGRPKLNRAAVVTSRVLKEECQGETVL